MPELNRNSIVVAADDQAALISGLYGLSRAEAEEHCRAFDQALAAGRPVELGEYVCPCAVCCRARP